MVALYEWGSGDLEEPLARRGKGPFLVSRGTFGAQVALCYRLRHVNSRANRMDRHLILDACGRASILRPVPASRAAAIATLYPRLYFTNVHEFMLVPSLKYPNAASEALAYGLSAHLISDEALLQNDSPFILVRSVGIEPIRLLRKWRAPDELVSVLLDCGPALVPPNTLLAWL
jgi:hypothetical protein